MSSLVSLAARFAKVLGISALVVVLSADSVSARKFKIRGSSCCGFSFLCTKGDQMGASGGIYQDRGEAREAARSVCNFKGEVAPPNAGLIFEDLLTDNSTTVLASPVSLDEIADQVAASTTGDLLEIWFDRRRPPTTGFVPVVTARVLMESGRIEELSFDARTGQPMGHPNPAPGVTLREALGIASAASPGKIGAISAEADEETGMEFFAVNVVDPSKNLETVYIDRATGEVLEDFEEDDGDGDNTGEVRDSVFSLDVSLGVAGLNGFERNEFFVALTPRVPIRRTRTVGLDLTFPLIWIPDPYLDPWWEAICREDPEQGFCPFEIPSPLGFSGIQGDELRVGPSFIVAPSLELIFQVNRRWWSSLFLGAGFLFEQGQSTEIDGVGVFTTSDSTSPVVTYGGALSYQLSSRTSLRLEGRFLTSFLGPMSVTDAAGRTADAEGGTFTSGLISIGMGFEF